MNRLFVLLLSLGTVCVSCAEKQPVLKMVDENATAETKALYRNLGLMQEKGIMFGHQDDLAYGIGWKYEQGASDVKKVTGDYPAVYGWEIGHVELGDSLSLDSIHFSKITQFIKEGYERGGVNTVSWHLSNPLTGGSAWDVSSKEVVGQILAGGEVTALYKNWLNRLAAFFLSQKDAQGRLIPILFRPFHEHSGSWFWWGKALCSTDEYKGLWKMTADYLRDTCGVHNLIYIYSPDRVASVEEYVERYPGDEYVDVLGMDLYHRNGAEKAEDYMQAVKNTMEFLSVASVQKNKPFVFSETGSEQIPMEKWFTEVLYKAIVPSKPAYVLLWRNAYERPVHYFAPYPGHPACEDFIAFKNLPDVFFEGELPAMYK